MRLLQILTLVAASLCMASVAAWAQLNPQEQAVANLMANAGGQNRPSVSIDPILSRVARARAIDMAKRRYFSHTNPDGRGPNFLVRAAGYPLPSSYSSNGNNIESIAAGEPSASGVWGLWMDSTSHRTHLLAQQSFFVEQTSIGVGYYFEAGSEYQHYWVVLSAPPPGPSLAITSPLAGAGITASQVMVSGTTGGAPAAARVLVRVENAAGVSEYQTATGTATWSVALSGLEPGANTIRVRSVDAGGGTIRELTRAFRYVVMRPLTVAVDGAGAVTRGFAGTTQRELGATLRVTATPGVGMLFDRWSGSLESTSPTLAFTMREGLSLVANFRVNPFFARRNSYSGLVAAATPDHASSGFFRVSTTASGTFSGRLTLAGRAHALIGKFDADGEATVTIRRGTLAPLTLQLRLDLTGTTGISGTISDGTFTSTVTGDAATPPLEEHPATGRYTVAFQPNSTDVGEQYPKGTGTATLLVTRAGVASLSGALADGRIFSTSANVSATGRLPLYVPLLSGTGSLVGTIMIDGGSLTGSVRWTKPARPMDKLFPAAFATTLNVTGSPYVPPTAGRPALTVSTQLENTTLRLSGGNLVARVDQTGTLLPTNRLAVSTPRLARLALAVVPSTGRVTGTFQHPVTGAASAIRGVILQDRNLAAGYFLGRTESGPASLAPR